MARKPKGWKGPTWTEYLLRHKNQRGLSFRQLARECDMSDASWHALVTGKGPPNYHRAKQAIEALKMKKNTWLNIVFKDRFFRWAKLEGILQDPPTPTIKQIIDSLLSWNPEEDSDESSSGDPSHRIYYGNFDNSYGMEIAPVINGLPLSGDVLCQKNRTEGLRIEGFQ